MSATRVMALMVMGSTHGCHVSLCDVVNVAAI
jgi:hypothetical protein